MKILAIIFAFFVLRLLSGCIECDNEPIPFDFSGIEVIPMDNTGTWTTPLEGDTMARNAIAFEIRLFPDDLFVVDTRLHRNVAGFESAIAMEECPARFQANQTIENIDVSTVFNMSETIPGGSSVIDSMVAYKNNSGLSYLYLPLNELLDLVNPEVYMDEPLEKFMLFLKPGVKNDSIQMRFNVHFSDGRILSTTTDVIYLY